MLSDLSPTVFLRGQVLEVHLRSDLDRTEAVGSAGLLLMPTFFTHRASIPVLPGLGATIMYAARGQGAMWADERPVGFEPLAALMGRGRATVLVALDEPLTTGALAQRLSVTPSAVSQQLTVLRAAGLVTSNRRGRTVLHMRSELGDQLVG